MYGVASKMDEVDMRARSSWLGAVFVLGGVLHGTAQTPALADKGAAVTPAVERHDPDLDAASNQIGRALFLRCFCAENNLAFDVQGHLESPKPDRGKTVDWTLAGVNVLKVKRSGPSEIELDGVRVAIGFAPDRREFDRHPQTDETMKILVADTGDAKAFERALAAIFATGIDRSLQHAMPEFWQHYFEPQKSWDKDALTAETILTPGVAGAPAQLTEPVVTHKAEAGYTSAATHDRVHGVLLLRMVVDDAGVPQRLAIVQPLGYGLDAKAIEATEKCRFTPALLAGKAVATNVQMRQDFIVVAPPK